MSVFVSRANRALVVPDDSTMRNLFPDAKMLGDRRVIDHGLREHVILSRFGVRTPNPMLVYYDNWGPKTPFHVQRSTCAMLTTNQRAYVLNDMGTGKTKAALWVWDYLNQQKLSGKLMVCAPLSTLNFVWKSEVFETLPHRKAVVLWHPDKGTRLDRLNDPEADIFIVNHDGIKVIYDELMAAKHIDHLVIDELAAFRNENDRSKLMRKLADRMEWVWGMTGSPMPNEPPDVWMQAKIITPTTVPKRKGHAREQLMTKINKFKWVPRPGAIDDAYKYMQPSVRYTLEDVTELPDFIERTIDVPLSGEQRRVYDLVAKHFQAMTQAKKITAANAGAAMSKLLQISAGYVYAEGDTVELTPNGSLRADIVMEIIRQARHKVIVFATFRHVVDGLSKMMTGDDPKKPLVDHAVVHGDVKDRDQIFNDFQNSERYKVLLAHPQCMAHGLTLTAANVIVWFNPTTSLDIYSQANARIRRIGQKQKQILLHLQSTPVEKRIYRLLRSKQKLQDELLELVERATELVEE